MSHARVWGKTTLALTLTAGFAVSVFAATAERSGKEVVESVCATCHATGKEGAPRMDDRAAWAERAKQGLGKLTEHAISGVRKMPAHGGQAGLSDLEMSRGIAYMVSGGHTVDPKKPYASPTHISGKELVEKRCVECHGTGKNGAPRIGDKSAWEPRLNKGVDVLLKSAIQGHNAMPARAGMANLSDAELNAAMTYMVLETQKSGGAGAASASKK